MVWVARPRREECTICTVKSQTFHGLAALRRLLGEREPGSGVHPVWVGVVDGVPGRTGALVETEVVSTGTDAGLAPRPYNRTPGRSR